MTMAGQAYGVSNVSVEVGTAVAGGRCGESVWETDCGAVRQIRLAKWTAVRCGAAKSQTKAASPQAIAAVTILAGLPLRESVR